MLRLPLRVQDDASNTPTAAQSYIMSGTGTPGMRTFAAAQAAGDIADGDTVLVLAEQVDANGNPSGAWETAYVTYDHTNGELDNRVLKQSSTGSLIDWSAGGVNATPRLTAIDLPSRVFTTTFAGDASVDIPCRAGCVQWVLLDAIGVSNDIVDLYLRVSTDGTTFDSGAAHYHWGTQIQTDVAASNGGSSAASQIQMSNTQFGNGGNGEEISGSFWIYSAADAGSHTRILGAVEGQSYLGQARSFRFRGQRLAAQADIVVRMLPSAGTLSGGRLTVYEFPL